jgi:superfamily II DNA or RNA helicase
MVSYPFRRIVITTVQTASYPDNIDTFASQDWELLIIDEAHHAPADSYVGWPVAIGNNWVGSSHRFAMMIFGASSRV